MVRPLMTDTVFLAQKALPADADDITVADDLLDTLKAHEDGCVGMARQYDWHQQGDHRV